MAQNVLSVTQVNNYIRSMMDADAMLGSIAVKGEISNYKLYPSGHHYFTLKDDGGALRCVLFKGNALRLRFRPENGMQVIAMGKISVFPRDGAYQLYCSALVPNGIGDLYAAFEQLKAKLAAQGLFDAAHKKPLPKYPGTIGIVTSPAGAAVHDMLRILRKRYPLTHVVLLPVSVQGAEAPPQIAAAIAYANRFHLADLLIIGRGGGSMEDLWAFNEEIVAQAVYRSQIPVISAVGHEPDVTISDFVADLRAATPSNAAELAVPDRQALCQTLDSMSTAMATAMQRRIKSEKTRLAALRASPALQSPQAYLTQRRKSLQLLRGRLMQAQTLSLGRKKERFVAAAAKLDALSPLKVLGRGYAMAQKEDGSVIRRIDDVSVHDRVKVSLVDGAFFADIVQIKENRYESAE